MISLIVPIYNEEKFILRFLEFVYSNCEFSYELLLVDGESEDKTIEIIESFIDERDAKNIFLLNNTNKYVSYALNIAISNAKYGIIIRMDVHTDYSTDYFSSIIKAFDDSEADIVGGPSNTKSYFPIQESIAYCFSSSFGIISKISSLLGPNIALFARLSVRRQYWHIAILHIVNSDILHIFNLGISYPSNIGSTNKL